MKFMMKPMNKKKLMHYYVKYNIVTHFKPPMPSPWITHVKNYQKKHNVSYKEAMKQSKTSYKPKSKTKPKRRPKRRIIRHQSGNGFLSNLFKKGKVLGKKVIKALSSEQAARARSAFNTNPKSRPGFAGEKHGIELSGKFKGSSYNYMGPGTRLAQRLSRGDPPINQADRVAKRHDIAYSKLKGLSGEQLKRTELKADKDFLMDIKKYDNLPEVKVAMTAIASKMAGQIAGKIPWGAFVDKV